MTIHLDRPDPLFASLVSAAFPSYRGKMFKLRTMTPGADGICRENLAGSWSGGSRDTYAIVRLADRAHVAIPAQSAFDAPIAGVTAAPIPPGCVVVKHTIFCGKDLGITVLVAPSDVNGFALPAAVELTPTEAAVLDITGSLKSFARDDERQRRGIARADYEAAKEALITRGLLNKAGAITPAGRNARPSRY
jgi:GNAT superfamily N-acetyltransferase